MKAFYTHHSLVFWPLALAAILALGFLFFILAVALWPGLLLLVLPKRGTYVAPTADVQKIVSEYAGTYDVGSYSDAAQGIWPSTRPTGVTLILAADQTFKMHFASQDVYKPVYDDGRHFVDLSGTWTPGDDGDGSWQFTSTATSADGSPIGGQFIARPGNNPGTFLMVGAAANEFFLKRGTGPSTASP